MHKVKCYFCGKTFDRDKIAFEKVGERRYSHAECYDQGMAKKQKEDNDLKELEEYIKELFGLKTVSVRILQQINKYKKEHNYTYSGMLKSLIYFYEVKGNDKSKANNGIGIIPYIYDEAFNYYYNIWEANNKNAKCATVKTEQKIVKIPIPTVKKKENNFFTFLTEEQDSGK